MAATLLLATLHNLDVPHFLTPAIVAATTSAQYRLVVVLFSPLFDTHIGEWTQLQSLLTFIYVQATKVAQDLNKPLLDVDVLLRGMYDAVPDIQADSLYRVQGDCILASLPESILSLPQNYIPPQTAIEPSASGTSSRLPLLPVVALGGTFDHLHAGHKILLSMAAWISSTKIIVGITDDTLLKNKKYREVMEDLPRRTERVHEFLRLFRPGIIYDIVPIQDVYGPTGWDPNIQGLVVSYETLSGAESIAAYRAEKALPPLELFVIDVISPTSSRLDHTDIELLKTTKMSSTLIREHIVLNSTAVNGKNK